MSLFERVLEGLESVRVSGKRATALCPAHDDRSRSLSVACGDDGRVLVNCFAGCAVEDVCAALDMKVADLYPTQSRGRRRSRGPQTSGKSAESALTPDPATTWRLARERARDDRRVHDDDDVYKYVLQRGLAETWEEPGYGVLGRGMELPTNIEWWPGQGYRLVLPVYSPSGQIAGIQARSIRSHADPKTRFPRGLRVAGCAFANRSGRDVLAGSAPDGPVLVGEGLTDHLALSSVFLGPVISIPGTGMATSFSATWAKGKRVVLAVDNDEAGNTCASVLATTLRRVGAAAIFRVSWPEGCVDACDVVSQSGMDDLDRFLSDHLAAVGAR